MTGYIRRLELLAAAAIIAVAFSVPAGAASVDDPTKPPTAPSSDSKDKKPDEKTDAKATDTKAPDPKPEETKPAPDKKSDNQFRDGYKQAYDLIYRNRDYAGGIAALRALHREEHPDVANLIGFASRKLGRTEDAKVWYEKALAADPKHTRTWQYYGMWYLERGDREKAEEHLEKIRLICGQGCDDYKSLREAIEDKSTY